MSNFTQEFMTKLFGKVPNEYLAIINKEIELHCAEYSIEKVAKDIVPYTNYIPECYKAFLVERVIAGFSKQTLNLNKLYLEDFFEAVRKPLEAITSNDIKLYLYNTQTTRGLSNRSLESRRTIIVVFFKWAAAEEYIQKDPSVTVKHIKFTAKPRIPLSGPEREQVRLACKNIREQTLFEFLYSTGCRDGELINLRWEDINLDTKDVHLFGKGNKWRTTQTSDKAIALLKIYFNERKNKQSPYVFAPEKGKNEQISRRAIQTIIQDIGERSGINRRLFPHLIRHTTATDLVKHGMPIQEVQKSMGHEKIETTMVYAHVDSEQTRIDHEKYIA